MFVGTVSITAGNRFAVEFTGVTAYHEIDFKRDAVATGVWLQDRKDAGLWKLLLELWTNTNIGSL